MRGGFELNHDTPFSESYQRDVVLYVYKVIDGVNLSYLLAV